MARYALVDIDSNTVRLSIYEIDRERKTPILLFSEKETPDM